ncbi:MULTISPECIES: hypothetical protein [Clostridium]|uniref:Uncharacterized protein n=1 Tax=Candidatus Clostridium helianthi TaxID=3381660 RepID=A0ABW8S2Q2_9CLOT|nr:MULTISPECIES: hypothetical protein [Clostridium]
MGNRSYRRCENSNVLGAEDINTILDDNNAYNQDIINEIFLM